MNPLICILFIVFLIVIIFLYRCFTSGDRITSSSTDNLRRNAKIIDIRQKTVGLKGDYKFRTIVTFDDGFEFIAHDTERDNHLLYYTISVSSDMKNEIIARATEAHNRALDSVGIKRPSKPFVCGKCGHKGPYDGNCPECGSSLKKY